MRPYMAEAEILPGRGVVQGSADNKVTVSEDGSGDFIGVYPWEANMAHDAGDQIGIALSGVVKADAGGAVNAGKKAAFSGGGRFVEPEGEAGAAYPACGVFLESGGAGDYVGLLIERGVVFVPEGTEGGGIGDEQSGQD